MKMWRRDKFMKISVLIRLMKADFMKMKHTWFYWIHICIPLIGAAVFLLYYSAAPWKAVDKISGYFEALCLAFPILIGIVCEMVIEKESEAGRFKEMLSLQYGKGICFLSKILILLISGLISLFAAVSVFFIGFQYILNQNILPVSFYMIGIGIVFIAQVFIYIFHIGISIRFGRGASIGMGIFEMLVAALLETGLGDGIWQMVPCSWAVRFIEIYFINAGSFMNTAETFSAVKFFMENCMTGFRNCIIFTLILGIFSAIWFKSFEGSKIA